MSSREKIIVAIMALTVLLGGYSHFYPSQTAGRERGQRQSVDKDLVLARQLVGRLKADPSLERDLFTIRSAERQWNQDPFINIEPALTDTPQHRSPGSPSPLARNRSDLVYSGFVAAGERRLAIINGIEYAPGETIDDQGHFIRRIQAHQVEIGKRNAPEVIILKLRDDEAITGQ